MTITVHYPSGGIYYLNAQVIEKNLENQYIVFRTKDGDRVTVTGVPYTIES